MGYYSTVTGELAIVPPLKPSALKGSRFIGEATSLSVRYVVTETVEPDGEDCTTTKRFIGHASPTWEDGAKYYDLEKDIRSLVGEVYAHGSTIQGRLVRVGEEQGDVERITVKANCEIVTEKAELRWPDGSKVEDVGR